MCEHQVDALKIEVVGLAIILERNLLNDPLNFFAQIEGRMRSIFAGHRGVGRHEFNHVGRLGVGRLVPPLPGLALRSARTPQATADASP